LWLPVAMHAHTLSKVGGRKSWWDPSASRNELTPPLSWEEALKVGHYLLDEKGKLKQEIRDIIHLVAESNRSFFFGHATHPEIFAMAEEIEKIGFKRAVVDHPFSPFVDLSIEQMKQLAHAGMYMNFTYDELSPLLGVDPALMYEAIVLSVWNTRFFPAMPASRCFPIRSKPCVSCAASCGRLD
jgi:hypothetical protein